MLFIKVIYSDFSVDSLSFSTYNHFYTMLSILQLFTSYPCNTTLRLITSKLGTWKLAERLNLLSLTVRQWKISSEVKRQAPRMLHFTTYVFPLWIRISKSDSDLAQPHIPRNTPHPLSFGDNYIKFCLLLLFSLPCQPAAPEWDAGCSLKKKKQPFSESYLDLG